MDKRARLLALNAFEQKQALRLNSSLKTRNAAMGQPDPELIAVASGANDVARTPEQERAELEARLTRFFKPHISNQILRHKWLTAPNIRDLLEVWYPIVAPHLRNLTGRRAEVRIEDIIAIFRVAVAQVPKTRPERTPAGPPLPPPTGPIANCPNNPYEVISQAQHAALAEQARLDAITQRQTALRGATLADVAAAAARRAAPPSSSSAPAAPAAPGTPTTSSTLSAAAVNPAPTPTAARHPPPPAAIRRRRAHSDTTPQPASSSANLVTPAAPWPTQSTSAAAPPSGSTPARWIPPANSALPSPPSMHRCTHWWCIVSCIARSK